MPSDPVFTMAASAGSGERVGKEKAVDYIRVQKPELPQRQEEERMGLLHVQVFHRRKSVRPVQNPFSGGIHFGNTPVRMRRNGNHVVPA